MIFSVCSCGDGIYSSEGSTRWISREDFHRTSDHIHSPCQITGQVVSSVCACGQHIRQYRDDIWFDNNDAMRVRDHWHQPRAHRVPVQNEVLNIQRVNEAAAWVQRYATSELLHTRRFVEVHGKLWDNKERCFWVREPQEKEEETKPYRRIRS